MTRYFVEIDGERCDFAVAAKRLGLSRVTLYVRQKKGQPLTTPLGHGGKPRIITINGTSKRLCDLSHESGLSASTISHRIRRGLSPSEATDPTYKPPHSKRRGKPITINETTLDLTGWAKRCEVSKRRMHQLFSRYPPSVAVLPRHERYQLFAARRLAQANIKKQAILEKKTEARAKRIAAGVFSTGPIPKRIACGDLELTAKEWASLFDVTNATIYLWNRLDLLGKQIVRVREIAERLQIAEEVANNKLEALDRR